MSRKGTSGWFVGLSVLGIIVALYMVTKGWGGEALAAPAVLIIGIFFVIKEVLDIFH